MDAGPLGGGHVHLSRRDPVNGGILVVTVSFDPGKEPAGLHLMGSFEEIDFPFFPLPGRPLASAAAGAPVAARVSTWGALVGVAYDHPVGASAIYVHLDTPTSHWAVKQDIDVRLGKYKSEILKVDPTRVKPPEDALPRIEAEKEETAKTYAASVLEPFLLQGFNLPIGTAVTSRYGNKRLFNGELASYHSGVDLRARVGTPVHAAGEARVALAKNLYYTGNTVILDHGFGIFTLYGHLSKIQVAEGQRVVGGDLLGLAGATGRVTGPHLHWGAVVHGTKVNPLDLLRVTW
ncbi:MAG TPA: M23 family metallopeptidase [Bdellovibrionota bacterium]|nr:M23 family metallopeptidase [Bdellovibrionota bacterium]